MTSRCLSKRSLITAAAVSSAALLTCASAGAVPQLLDRQDANQDLVAQSKLELALQAAEGLHLQQGSFPAAVSIAVAARDPRIGQIVDSRTARTGVISVQRRDSHRIVLRTRSASGQVFTVSDTADAVEGARRSYTPQG